MNFKTYPRTDTSRFNAKWRMKRSKSSSIKTLRKVEFNNTSTLKILPFVSTYNLRNKEAFNTIVSNLPIVQKHSDLKEFLCTHKIIKCIKQQKTVKKTFTKKRIIFLNNGHKSKTTCRRPNCKTCPNLMGRSEFHFNQEWS